jgi:hypothetical protein
MAAEKALEDATALPLAARSVTSSIP